MNDHTAFTFRIEIGENTRVEIGHIVLEGGAEFGGQMAAPDRRSIELAGGLDASIVIVPTAAAPDNNCARAGENGRRWFRSLGVANVQTVPLIDRSSASDSALVDTLANARLIYLLGGFPGYLCETLLNTPAWTAMRAAYAEGAVLAGSSAGAMVLCEHLYDPRGQQIVPGLGMVPNACVLPHHNTFGQGWTDRLRALLPEATLVGIDEETGMINDHSAHEWSVHGGGDITLYQPGQPISHPKFYQPGEKLPLSLSA